MRDSNASRMGFNRSSRLSSRMKGVLTIVFIGTSRQVRGKTGRFFGAEVYEGSEIGSKRREYPVVFMMVRCRVDDCAMHFDRVEQGVHVVKFEALIGVFICRQVNRRGYLM